MIITLNGKTPEIGKDVFIAPTAVLIGDVEVGDGSSIWFGAVLRGDFAGIRIGKNCSIQDNVVIHVNHTKEANFDTIIGDNVVIGHNATVEGCYINQGCVIGMNGVVLPRAQLGEQVMVAAGSVVRDGAVFPPRVLVAGVPAIIKKEIGGTIQDFMALAIPDYRQMQGVYRAEGIDKLKMENG